MRIDLRNRLPYVSAHIEHRGRAITLHDVVVDTGSSGTAFSMEVLASIGVRQEPEDPLDTVRGIGGTERVVLKRLDSLAVGNLMVPGFQIEMSPMAYGFPIQGIIGLDFLTAVGAILDFEAMEFRGVP